MSVCHMAKKRIRSVVTVHTSFIASFYIFHYILTECLSCARPCFKFWVVVVSLSSQLPSWGLYLNQERQNRQRSRLGKKRKAGRELTMREGNSRGRIGPNPIQLRWHWIGASNRRVHHSSSWAVSVVGRGRASVGSVWAEAP